MDDERKFNPVTPSAKEDIRPGFLGGSGGGEAPAGTSAESRAAERARASGAAAESLKDVEGAASQGVGGASGGVDGARQNESSAGGLFTGDGLKKAAVNVATRGKFKGSFRKAGPGVGILFVVFVIGAFMALTQGMQLFSLVANLQEAHNSMHTSASVRSARWIKWQLGGVKDPVKGRIFGNESFKISKKQSAELAKQGIDYDSDKNVLRYKNSSGVDIEVNASNFDRVYESDPDFFRRYNAGSQTWRGQFANWYGGTTNNWLKKNNLTRNMMKDYKQKVAEADGDGGKVMRDILKERTNTVDFGSDGGGKAKRDTLDQGAVREKLTSISAKFKGGDVFDIAANSTCAFVEIMGAFSGLVYAAQALQIMNIATLTFETVDKTKAGHGDEAPLNELANMFNERATNTNAVMTAEAGGAVGNVKLSTDYTSTTKSAMESEGIASLYSGKRANPNNPSLKSFNLTGSIRSVMGGIGGDMNVFKGCSFARVGTSIVSGVGTGVGIAACILGIAAGGLPGVFSCAPLVVGTLIGIGISAAVAVGIDMLVAAITPMITTMLVRDLTGIGGEDFGNANWLGSNLYQGSVGRANGLAYASVDSYKSFAVAKQQVLAENSRYERMSLSPFDVTSKNTFLGSIVGQLSNYMRSSSVMDSIVRGTSVASSSLMGLMPSVSATAVQIAEDLPTEEEYEGYCPFLASVGGIGDSGCVPYSDSDFSTIDEQPGEVIDVLDSLGAFTGENSDGNVTINKDSDFAKYVRYCPGRSSMLGTPDFNIKAELIDGTSTGNTAVDGAIGAMPLIGDGLTILEDTEVQRNFGYISGKSCVDGGGSSVSLAQTDDTDVTLAASNVSGTVAEGDNWNVARYYQRFIEDQSLAESMGLINKSAVTAYLEEYYQENPIDNSYEGMLARYSGLDKETVSDMLDVLAYYNYINDYDPSERYAFGAPVVDEKQDMNLEHEYVMDGAGVALEGVVYADVRNRSFAV